MGDLMRTAAAAVRWAGDLSRALARDVIGLAALGLVVAGVWGLAGWEWAAIAAGLPIAAFYVWGEARSVMRPRRRYLEEGD